MDLQWLQLDRGLSSWSNQEIKYLPNYLMGIFNDNCFVLLKALSV